MNTCPQKDLYENVIVDLFIIAKNWKTPKYIKRRMDKQIVIYPFCTILLNKKKEGTINTYKTMDEPQKYNV